MSVDTWMLDKDLCRCCHSEGKFKNLGDPCLDSETENYADMIKSCFDIDLAIVPGILSPMTYCICDACVTRIRDACRFKRRIQECDRKFLDFCSRKMIKVEDPHIINIDIDVDMNYVKKEEPEEIKEEDSDNYSLASLPIYDEDPHEDDMILEDDDEDIKSDTEKSEKSLKSEKSQKPQKKKPKKAVKPKPGKTAKKKGRPKKMAEEPIPEETEGGADEEKVNYVPPKFYLRDGDYTVNGEIFSCTRCDKTYDKIFSMRYHVKTKHYNIARFRCTYCREGFMTAARLTVHKLEVHNIDERFNCNACKGTFNTKVQLRKHIKGFHMVGERLKCKDCEYETFSFEAMYKHKFRHKTSKDHHCRFCRKAFVRKTTLDLHERIHTGDRRKVCSVCGQAFVQKASLNYHMAKYHPGVSF